MTFRNFHPANIMRAINWRAAIALLLLLLGWVATPVSLLAQERDTCAMECCMAEGHCCCATAKPFVEGQDYSGVHEIGQPEIGSSCPGLATLPSDAKALSRQATPAAAHLPASEEPVRIIRRSEESFYSSLRFSPDSSRAPPLLLINS
ncbi:MAG: hypothetical protein M3X11_00400 [Acidobacteriota bacterium]|nr:hypothetical protein [Acidobacteriota bacterium]